MAEESAQLSPGELVRAAEQLDAPDLDRLVADLLALGAHRKSPALDQSEGDLLQRINRGIPTDTQQRYNLLVKRRQAEDLAPDEYAELLHLSAQIEQTEAERAVDLVALARLRGRSLAQVAADLGIAAPARHD